MSAPAICAWCHQATDAKDLHEGGCSPGCRLGLSQPGFNVTPYVACSVLAGVILGVMGTLGTLLGLAEKVVIK